MYNSKIFYLVFLLALFCFGCNKDNSTTPTNSQTAPSSPTNLTISNNFFGSKLSWQTPSNNGGSTIIQYLVYRGTDSLILSNIGSVVYNGTTYTDKTGTDSLIYYYAVTALNASGESSKSNKAYILYKTVIGNWNFNFHHNGGYNNPPSTQFNINISGFFSKGVVLYNGNFGGQNNYSQKTISGTINDNGVIINGSVSGSYGTGVFTGQFNINNFSGSGIFSTWGKEVPGNNSEFFGTWSATK